MTNNIVGIRFQKFGKIYHFRAEENEDVRVGDSVVVETSRGQQLGEVIQILEESEVKREGYLKPITRVATPKDLVLRQVWEYKEKEAVEACRSKVKELEVKGVKIIDAEYTFDGKRLTFLYGSDDDESLDLTELREAMKGLYRRTRVDLRKIGPRDVAKIIGGMGICGLAVRCCSRFLTDFHPISIRMAKVQGVSLSPTEITGMCGRLRCCLFYEFDHYVEARKELPKEKKQITTPSGEGKVISVSPLIKKVTVALDDGDVKEFSLEELQEPKEAVDKRNQGDKDDGRRPHGKKIKSSRTSRQRKRRK
jgi:cell fate regulator YaaT (PSP1 superfamily)